MFSDLHLPKLFFERLLDSSQQHILSVKRVEQRLSRRLRCRLRSSSCLLRSFHRCFRHKFVWFKNHLLHTPAEGCGSKGVLKI